MAGGFAHHPERRNGHLRHLRRALARRPEWWKPGRTRFRNCGLRFYVVCGLARWPQETSSLAFGTRSDLDARPFMAWADELAAHFVPRRVPVRRTANQRFDGVAHNCRR